MKNKDGEETQSERRRLTLHIIPFKSKQLALVFTLVVALSTIIFVVVQTSLATGVRDEQGTSVF
jgi:hypothetical protein